MQFWFGKFSEQFDWGNLNFDQSGARNSYSSAKLVCTNWIMCITLVEITLGQPQFVHFVTWVPKVSMPSFEKKKHYQKVENQNSTKAMQSRGEMNCPFSTVQYLYWMVVASPVLHRLHLMASNHTCWWPSSSSIVGWSLKKLLDYFKGLDFTAYILLFGLLYVWLSIPYVQATSR